MKQKFLGALVGCGLGDAIGELAFHGFDARGLAAAVSGARRLVYTDDTAMAIGIAESLAELGRIDQEHLGRRFHANFRREPWRGYGSGPPRIFAMVEREGVGYAEAARRLFGGAGSFGNGAAMRTAPVGLAFHRAPDLYEKACEVAATTHAHPVGQDGAAIQAMAVAQAVDLPSGEGFEAIGFCDRLIEAARTAEIREKMRLVSDLLVRASSSEEAAACIGRTVAVHESMPFAIFAFLREPQSFERCITCAVLNGGDRDTLGAMAGSISGAYLGVEAIPREWRARLENRATIEELASRLAALAPKPS